MASTPTLREYLLELSSRREFVVTMARSSLRSQHLDTVLGNLWHVLNPLLQVGVYYLVFGIIIGTNRGLDNFIGFLTIGVFSFGLMRRIVMAAGNSLTGNLGLMRSLQFPRVILPASTVVRELLGFGFSYGVMLVVLVVSGEPLKWGWFLSPVIIALMAMYTTGLALIVARLSDRVRDISNLVPFIFRIIFYLSGIIFSLRSFITPRRVEASQLLSSLGTDAENIRLGFTLNPFFSYIELLRDALMSTYGAEHPAAAWAVALVAGPTSLAIGLLVFRSGEREYGRA